MKAGWEASTLGEICEIISGAGFPKKHQGEVAGEFPFFKVGDMNSEGNETNLVAANHYISEETRKKLGARILPSESIVFPKVGGAISTNKKRRLVSPSCVDNNVMGLAPNKEKVNPVYLAWWMDGVDIYEFSNKAALPSITKATVSGWPFPLPPLEEQKRIVAVLDGAFEGLDRARTHIQTNLQNARELFDCVASALIVNADELEQVSLGDVSSIPSSLVDPKLPEFLDQPHVGAGNMETGRDILVDVKTSREEGLKSGKYTFDGSMVLYSKIRPYLKKVARPDFVGLCSADMYPLLPDADRLNKNFLFHLLLSEDFTDYAISGSDRAGMPKVNQTHLFKYTFGLPSLAVQADIVEKVDATLDQSEQLQAQYCAKLADLADLRQSLLQKAFAGELT